MNRLEKLLTILLTAGQRLENTGYDMLVNRAVDTAVGAQLDILGRIVGQDRAGLDDDTYRRYIRARVASNRSTGKRDELLAIAVLVINSLSASFVGEDKAIATYFMRVDGVAVDGPTMNALMGFIKSAIGAGIRPMVQTAPAVPSGMFKFSGGTAGPGFDNTAAPGTGGKLADLRDGN